MKISFKNADTGRYVKDFKFVVKHVYKVEYTDNLQEAYLINKEDFETPRRDESETKMQVQLKWCKEKLNQNIVPLDVTISL
ncbi:hypothetical protein GC093_13400 [Paenibacillus sp. LMG 31456]|uniref:Uncharacterized protein n=1 Tax=Paenibacillus foliorum TaxID=2654974 RepID=A0A972GQC1_9BACL|nr:hypothetical protein [Paenibacillus foliorum]NOU94205.1 hypothetical protein [Paenibacillus foliorum]